MQKKDTSWGKHAEWYHELLEKEGTYQKEVVLPNVARILDPQKGELVLDLACGTGFFSRALAARGAQVIGVDVAKASIAIAKQKPAPNLSFKIAPSHKLEFIESESVDKIALILAAQNIEELQKTFMECARVLKHNGLLCIVMNHPAFRVLKRSSWEWDEKAKTQYRRVDGYMSESTEKIQMHPGERPSEYTISFHRPLQVYFKDLKKAGLLVRGLEEWISHKKSEVGPRAREEDRIRKEIPMFLMLEVIKI